MDYIDNKTFLDGEMITKNNLLKEKVKHMVNDIETRIRQLNIQPPQFTFHEQELAYESFKLTDSIELIQNQIDNLDQLTGKEKNIKLITLLDSLRGLEQTLDDLESMPYS
tara:strand:- start:1539 stop:1868 length:330 start_codon:yes stop_codon:yes gene_type:complete